LELYEKALPISREVGNRAGEAATLNGLAFLYQDFQRYSEALKTFDASIQLAREVMYPTAEIAGWVGRAQLLFAYFPRAEDALLSLEHAQEIFLLHNLSHDAAGRTLEDVEQLLERMKQGKPLAHSQDRATLPASLLIQVVENTRAVLSHVPERKAEWEEQVRQLLAHVCEQGEDWQQEAELFTSLLALLEGKEARLPNEHSYIAVIEAVQQGESAEPTSSLSVSDDLLQAIQEFFTSEDWLTAQFVVEARQVLLFQPEAAAVFQQRIAYARTLGDERLTHHLETHLALLLACQRDGIESAFAALLAQRDGTSWPFDPRVIPRSIAALLGGPPEKYACFQYLLPLVAQTTDEAFRQLLAVIQQALVGRDPSQLGQDLTGRYKDAWETILKGIETEKE
jgi:tetratricopeptide (TPR) repeat protein